MSDTYFTNWFQLREGDRRTRLRSGWILAGGEILDPDRLGGADLAKVELVSPTTLRVGLIVGDRGLYAIEFSGLAQIELWGDLGLGVVEEGWEVFGVSMLLSDSTRADGKLVYFLELPRASLCFASLPGIRVGP